MINEIKYLFPLAVNGDDFKVQDNSDGEGVFISFWDTAKLGKQPTQAQLNAAKPAAELVVGQASHNAPILAQMAELERKIVCALCEQDAGYMALKAQLK